MEIIIIISGLLLLISLVVIIYNLFTAPSLKYVQPGDQELFKRVSILIPARNEEYNIKKCLYTLLNQDMNIHEIIVLNDESTDNTKQAACELAAEYPVIKVINGKSLPVKWNGKTWACQQLGQAAKGDILLFLDADVELEPWAVRSAVNLFIGNKLSMLSCFPTQRIKFFGEWITVPLMNWLLLSFLPLKLVYSSRNNSFVAANGQFIMVNRKTYIESGGHEIVASKIVEDMELARKYKSAGLRIMTVLGETTVFCRMYNSFSEAFNGFRKNFFTGFNMPAVGFLMFILFLFALYFSPFILIFIETNFIWLIDIILLSRIITSVISNQSILINLLLHPFQMVIMFITGIFSIVAHKKKQNVWKQRTL